MIQPTPKHQHSCEQCQVTFDCDDSPCGGKRYCSLCLKDAVAISAEVMGDY